MIENIDKEKLKLMTRKEKKSANNGRASSSASSLFKNNNNNFLASYAHDNMFNASKESKKEKNIVSFFKVITYFLEYSACLPHL